MEKKCLGVLSCECICGHIGIIHNFKMVYFSEKEAICRMCGRRIKFMLVGHFSIGDEISWGYRYRYNKEFKLKMKILGIYDN